MADKFDALSDMRIPFDIATWIRGHKFNTASVAIVRKLNECIEHEAAMLSAEQRRDKAEEELKQLCEDARTKMEATHV